MESIVSPKYIMILIDKIEKVIWEDFQTYKKVMSYIKRWQETNEEYNMNYGENFPIKLQKNSDNIDLIGTLSEIPDDIILKIAIDLGIETPDFIPSIAIFKNDLKESYKTSFKSFENALKNVEEHPDMAVSLANSTLESIIKYILNDENISTKYDNRKTLYKLTEDILKEFKMFPNKEIGEEIKNIGSGFLKISQNIETLRSDKTFSHGKINDDYVIEDSLYAYFVINSISTIGTFLISFYEKKYKNHFEEVNDDNISVDDLPF